jgi:peptidyl-tRNA hydrolase, PTH1 family
MKNKTLLPNIKIIMGLGNPGERYYYTRHSIGYRIADALAEQYKAVWRDQGPAQVASIEINEQPVLLVKSNSYMNDSGKAIPLVVKQEIATEHLLVIHDELEKPFGTLAFKVGGSHRGHNGLRSLIHVCGANFIRLRIGIGRPDTKEEVSTYVLERFTQNAQLVQEVINKAVGMIETLFT